MKKFKVGDRVRRIHVGAPHGGMDVGDEDIVTDVKTISMDLKDYGRGHSMKCFELVEDTSKHHKHHDLIIQWAKGAEIEFWNETFTEWFIKPSPDWRKTSKYRIKPPTPKANKERIAELEARVKELEGRLNE